MHHIEARIEANMIRISTFSFDHAVMTLQAKTWNVIFKF